MVHFILSKGELTWQYRRAIKSAEVHGEPITLWFGDHRPPYIHDIDDLGCELRPINIPDWLINQPGAYIYDYLALQVLVEHGGMVLGLDTLSIRSAMDLLGDYELCVACDVPINDYRLQTRPIDHPFNNIMLGKKESGLLWELFIECGKRLKKGYVINPDDRKIRDLRWGDTGPGLLTVPVLDNPERATWAPFPALCGWEGSFIWQYYCGLETPSDNVRVIHLYSSAYRTLYEGKPDAVEKWVEENPDFKWVLPNKMPEILKCA